MAEKGFRRNWNRPGCGIVVGITLLLAAAFVGGIYWLASNALSCPFDRYYCVALKINGTPRVGNPVELVVNVRSASVSNTEAEISLDLPPGVAVVDGEPIWRVEVPGEGKSVSAVWLEVTQPGEWAVTVYATPVEGQFGNSETIYLSGSEGKGKSSLNPSPNHWISPNQAQNYPLIEPDERYQGVLVISDNPRLDGEVTITHIVTANVDIPDAVIGLDYPPMGFQVQDVVLPIPVSREPVISMGDVAWRGQLQAGQPLSLSARFRITETGSGYVSGYLNLVDQTASGQTRVVQSFTSAAYLSVNEYTGTYQIISVP